MEIQPSLVPGLDALAEWRHALERDLAALEKQLADADLLPATAATSSAALRKRLSTDKLVVAFVAEFSRGKSELINAIFFADAGRRILPATPGRTTMCPVELSWTPGQEPTLDLLAIETRAQSIPLAEWCEMRDQWRRVKLDTHDADALAASLKQVTQTRLATKEEATELGLWSEDDPHDNPPTNADGMVEIPAWRHAIINYPHPLLQRGLVVVDTPGLNAIGTEPELTLGLLPSAHAALFVLGADTGVTRSDLDIWTDHLGGQGLSCFVVLNKMDTLADPLATAEEQREQIERQRQSSASLLGIPPTRVFPVSARQALAARLNGDAAALAASRLPELESALNSDLLPQRQKVLAKAVITGVQAIIEQATRRLRDQRRQNAEQMLELRGLRGKSAGRVAQMLERVNADTEEFERCVTRLTALRAVHARLQRSTLKALEADKVREAVQQLQASLGSGWFNLKARGAFTKMCAHLQAELDNAAKLSRESGEMLHALFTQLNTEFGFTLTPTPAPELSEFKKELQLIEDSYSRYFSVTRSIRLNSEAFSDQFLRMLVSKLRVVFENATSEVETWNHAAQTQIDSQFRERRRSFKRRRESLERIQGASGELDAKLAEVETLDNRAAQLMDMANAAANNLRQRAERGPISDMSGQAGISLATRDGVRVGGNAA